MLNKKNSFTALALAVGVAAANPAFAKFEPAVVPVGGMGLMPTVNLQVKQDDNILSEETNPTSSLVTVVSPSLVLGADAGVNNYTLAYVGNFGFYSESEADNYTDSRVNFDVHQEFSPSLALDLGGEFDAGHEDRGAGYSIGNVAGLTEPDRYQTVGGSMLLNYGAQDSTGRVELAVDGNQRAYQTRLAQTAIFDRTVVHTRATFFYNLSAISSLLAEGNFSNIDYTDAAATIDSTVQRYYVGASWNVSDLTEGVVKAGWQIKDFANAAQTDFSGFGWEAGLNWTPMATTLINLTTASRTQETSSFGDYIDSKTVSGSLQHNISDLLSATITGDVTYNDYQPTDEEDGIVTAGVSMDYSMRRWLSTGVGYTYSTRKSNQPGLDYTRNIFLLNIQASM